MSSFAIWAEPESNACADCAEQHIEVELHINLWYAYGSDMKRSEDDTVLDIGIMVNGFSNVKNLNLYLPFRVDASCITDLGSRLHDNVTLNAVFNDRHRIAASSDRKAFLVTYNELGDNGSKTANEGFIVYELDTANDLAIVDRSYVGNGNGTEITIAVSKLSDLHKERACTNRPCNRCYFRIRIKNSELNDVIVHSRRHSRIDALFHDALTLTRIPTVNQMRRA